MTSTQASSLLAGTLSRRWFLGSSAAVAAGALVGCSTSSQTTGSASSSPTAAATAVATGAATAGSLAALAQAFYQTLSTEQQTSVLQDYSLANAERWSNLPQGLLGGGGAGGGGQSGMPSGGSGQSGMPSGGPGGSGGSAAPSGSSGSGGPGGGGSSGTRLGISIGDLSEEQLAAFTTLLKAATGTTTGLGYDEIEQHLNADDYLQANGGGDDYGRANYYVAILGSPADAGTWEFQFGGHHLAVANTFTDGKLVGATPSFRGIEPNQAFELNDRTNQPMKVKEAALTAMLAGLSSDQQTSARLSDTFTDLVLGAGQDWAFPDERVGVQVSSLSADQQQLVAAAIASYVNDIDDANAKILLATYSDELADTYVAWSGTIALTEQNDYVRIDGPSVWIEFSMQRGIVLSGNHPHSVWRDRARDYGGTKS